MPFKIDGYEFLPGEAPARGPIVEVSPQRWSEFNVLGAASPGTILTYLGAASQQWPYFCRASAATAAKLLAVYDAKEEVVFITPQNATGFKVIMTRFEVDYEVPIENSKYLCRFTLVSREAVSGGIPDEEEDVPTIIVKAAGETVNNSDTFQDDDELFFSVGANEIWLINYNVLIDILRAASDAKFRLTLPAGASSRFFSHSPREVAAGNDFKSYGVNAQSGSITVLTSADDSLAAATFWAIVKMGGTAGVCMLQWAQNVAVAEDLTIQDLSFLMAWKQ